MKAPLEILLVEDNEGDVEIVGRALKTAKPPCRLSVVHNGLDALDYVRKQGKFEQAVTPELILIDINMPRMDGKKLVEILKQEDRLKIIPAIMLTSSAAPLDVRDCYERHANGYVVKPFDAPAFIDAVREVVKFWGLLGRLPSRPDAA
jgi:two-component system, chemotaxis family, response regulator Rcp1